jgi:diguanylate cyclase (GGDEF)-like protein
MKHSLRIKIWLLNVGIVTGLSLLMLISVAWLASRENDSAVRRNVRATGSILEYLMNKRKARLLEQATLFADLPILKACLQTGDSATVSDCANDFLTKWHADIVVATGQEGTLLGVVGNDAFTKQEALAQSGVQAALHNNSWSGIVVHHRTLMLGVSVPVLIAGENWGTFSVYSAINTEVANELRDAFGIEVAFVQNGDVLLTTLSGAKSIPTPRSTPEVVKVGEESYFALYEPLPGTDEKEGIGYVVLTPHATAMGMFYRFRTALGIIFFLSLGLALLAGALVSGSVTKPLRAVVRAARTLQKGEWPERLPADQHDETGLLQRVFNEMTTTLKTSQERLMALIDTDPLTEVDNHRRFHERLLQEIKRCEVSEEPLSLLICNVDHFQTFNQQYGYAQGDEALKIFAECLRTCVPGVGIIARYAGDKFAVLLPTRTLEEAEAIGEKVRLACTEWTREHGLGEGLTTSIGCAEFGTHSKQADGFVMAAELAATMAKQLGRNRVCRFDSLPGTDEGADPYQLYQFFQDGSLATIQALAAAVDAKDAYTRGHSQRVAQYACELAQVVGLSESEVELVRITGTLHDVGKIGVPDSVLKKPGRLTDEERQVMETHPVLGEEIVKKAPQLAPTLPGVRHHHERWDGKGYPDGLAGEEIPLIARLLAIADTYDAMTSDRPYRKGMDAEIALSEIEKGAGTQFAPDLAIRFVQIMREMDERKAA